MVEQTYNVVIPPNGDWCNCKQKLFYILVILKQHPLAELKKRIINSANGCMYIKKDV